MVLGPDALTCLHNSPREKGEEIHTFTQYVMPISHTQKWEVCVKELGRMMIMLIIALSSGLSILHGLLDLVLIKALLSGFYYYPHATDEETGAQSR